MTISCWMEIFCCMLWWFYYRSLETQVEFFFQTYLSELTLSLVMPLQLAMNMPMVEFSSVHISLGVASGSPCAVLPLALLYATTLWQSPVWTVSPCRKNTFTPVVVILLQYRSQANGHFIEWQLEKPKKENNICCDT